jgi:uncharacterized protein
VKILLISDKPSPALYDHFNPDIFQGVNIVISCGDLPAYYLEFIITMLNVPCYYVPGNHDTAFVKKPPPGWDLLDGKVIDFQGLSIMGFGGSMKYKVGPFQYTEKEMKARLLRMKPKLWRKKNKIDILVTHAPAENLGDLEDLPHKGFKTFQYILDHYKPKYFLHGHVHLNYSRNPRQIKYGETEIINGYEYHIFDY